MPKHNKHPIALFGEVLIDQFPEGQRILGGAPFNVAWHLQAFGQPPCFISRIGNDETGELIQHAMNTWGLSKDALQIDPIQWSRNERKSPLDDRKGFDIVPEVDSLGGKHLG